MKVLCLTSTLILVVLAQEPTDKSGSELSECGSRVTDKIQALSGKFLGKDELADLLHQSFEMYYKQSKTLKEINDYFVANYRNIGLDADQVATITDVYMKIQGILGGLEVIKDYYRKAQETAFEFIKEDQRQVDQNIKLLKERKANDINVELSVCRQVFTLITAQKKIQLENKLFALLPADKVEAVKVQLRRVTKLLTDSQSS